MRLEYWSGTNNIKPWKFTETLAFRISILNAMQVRMGLDGGWRMEDGASGWGSVCARVCVFALLLWFDVFLCSDLCYKTKSSNYAKFIAKLHISTDFSKPFNSIQFILNKWNDLKLLCCNAKRFCCRKIVGRSTSVLNGVCEFESSKGGMIAIFSLAVFLNS